MNIYDVLKDATPATIVAVCLVYLFNKYLKTRDKMLKDLIIEFNNTVKKISNDSNKIINKLTIKLQEVTHSLQQITNSNNELKILLRSIYEHNAKLVKESQVKS